MSEIINKDISSLQQIFLKFEYKEDVDHIDLLVELVDFYRKKAEKKELLIDISGIILLLTENQNYRQIIHNSLKELTHRKDFDQIISDSGIMNYSDFLYEVKKRTIQKFLPHQAPVDTLEYMLNQIFHSSKDPKWIQQIPKEQLLMLFRLTGIPSLYADNNNFYATKELLYGLEVLTQRVSGRAMEADVSKMVPEYRNFDSPFIGLLNEMSTLINFIREHKVKFVSANDINYKQLTILLTQCEKCIDNAFSNAQKYGISLKVNQTLLRIKQQLYRIKKMARFIVLPENTSHEEQSLDFFIQLITINCNKTNVSRLINESTQVLAYEITQHTAQTGEHYITSSKKEYLHMFWSACGGGAIVAVLCIIKLLLSKIDGSIFGHAVLYSLNYAIGFTLIYLLGCTLATKQPAMTAAALVSALSRKSDDKNSSSHKYWEFANFFSRLFRSQFIAFVGNVFVAFPVALLLIWGIDLVLDYNIADSKWRTLLKDLDPIDSPAIYHSAIAGVFLFLSGIIAGSIANRDKFNDVYYRIEQHPTLKRIFGKEKTIKIAQWYKKKWAGIISNLWFGTFMGTTGAIGIFLGLDLDIRHITFASGNLALGIYGGDFRVPTNMIIWGIIGIGVIGFVNFIVSFTLSLFLAFRARKIKLIELFFVSQAIWALFLVNPIQFFIPPKKDINT